MKIEDLNKYPKRKCKTIHECVICNQDIRYNEEYYDGGIDKRCHVCCYDRVFIWGIFE